MIMMIDDVLFLFVCVGVFDFCCYWWSCGIVWIFLYLLICCEFGVYGGEILMYGWDFRDKG